MKRLIGFGMAVALASTPVFAQAPIPAAASVSGAVPPGFKQIVDERKAAQKMRLIAWWQDDLDGDGQGENIAELCNDDDGVYLIEHEGAVLLALFNNWGPNACPAERKPDWKVVHQGYIEDSYHTPDALEMTRIAVRGHQAVTIYQREDGADGRVDIDWEALTISDNREHRQLKAVHVVALADADPRWTSVGKGVSVSATIAGDKLVVHVKSAAQVSVSICPAYLACTKQIARPVNGVADLIVPDQDGTVRDSFTMLELDVAGEKSRAVMFRAGAMVGGYPSAAPPTDH